MGVLSNVSWYPFRLRRHMTIRTYVQSVRLGDFMDSNTVIINDTFARGINIRQYNLTNSFMKYYKSVAMRLLMGVIFLETLSLASLAQGSNPPEDIDFSVLKEENPQSELSVQSGYAAALQTTWHALHSNSSVKWIGDSRDRYFACSASAFSVKAPYSSYLVTSPLSLDVIGGKILTFELSVPSFKGSAPFRILLIDKDGKTLQTLYEHQYAKQDFTPTSVSIPIGMTGIGFIAFVNQGSDKKNFASYCLKNIELKAPSTEVAITYNPADGLEFSEVAAGEIGATKGLEVFIQNFSGTPEVSLTGINKEDFILKLPSGALTATGGKINVTFVPKNGNPAITAAVTVTAGKTKVDIPLRAAASGSSAKIKVSAMPERIDFGSVAVGKTSTQQATSITVQNAIETPMVTLVGANKGDFDITLGSSFDNHGGGISVTFTPTAVGTRTASIEVNASGTILQIPLQGTATESGGGDIPTKPEPKEDRELLVDNFFYNFDEDGRPTSWSYRGNITKELRGYNSSTGFAVQIDQTKSAEIALLYQEIDIDAVSFSMAQGSVLEGMVHYSVQEPFADAHGLRLACQWMDANHKPIVTTEDAFIASDRYVEWRKAWDEIRFRTVVPSGARYFRFGVEVSAGSLVKVDDCSLLRLTRLHAQDRFVSVLPHALHQYGKTTEPMTGTLLVQSMSSYKIEAKTSTPSGTFTLTPSELPAGNLVTTVSYAVRASEPGAYISGSYGVKPYSVRYDDDNAWASMRINAYIIDPSMPPSVQLSTATPNKALSCTVGEAADLELDFDVSGVIQEVKVQLTSESGYFKSSTSSFYYSPTQKKVLNNKVKVSFSPREAGRYTAKLTLTTACMDPIVLEIVGEAMPEIAEWMETFAEEKSMDPRFKGDNWNNYHRFDKGYYYLDGSWVEAGKVSINRAGLLESDELLLNGIEHLKLIPAMTSGVEVFYTIDGGGHWAKSTLEGGVYKIHTHRPTRFKIVNKSSGAIQLEKILLSQSPDKERQSIKEIAKAMMLVGNDTALGHLEEYFDGQRHTRGINLGGWQSFASLADRPFRGWEQKNKSTQAVEETCAQISFFNSLDKNDQREQEAWLVSPLLSKTKAQSMYLTFRLRYELPTEDGKEQFGVYILTPDGQGSVKPQVLDISKLLLVPDMEPERWYDYCVDLSKVDGLKIDDYFYIAFTMYSPHGGTTTSLTFMVDDVTFGRTDLPVIKANPEQINFTFKPNLPCPAQTIQVSVEHPKKEVTISLVPSKLKEEFKLSALQLPAEGGNLAVGFSTKKTQDRAAALLLQTRGGVSKLVRLLAQKDNGVEILDPLHSVYVYPTTTTEQLNLSEPCQCFWIYTTDGTLALQGTACQVVNVSVLAPARYYISLRLVDGGVITLPFDKQ